ncbi:hypothetical protein [Oceanospirillum beijerinckii]|uniref:hypothetical protein n=1 Tax=Oceanospirillum beijerinckii TaxID=64976 RepID=UPI0003F59FFC|nr:hypothetical protein [Oceanospirillum beijerinckii]
MTEEEVTLSGQIAALIEAVGGWQSEAMKALQDALASTGGVDQTQLIALINQHLSAPETLATMATAVVQSDSTAQQIQQLIGQYSAAEVTDAVRNVLQYLPDTSNVTGTTLADNYSSGQSVIFRPSGASTPSGAPVTWHLTDLVGVNASATEIPDGQSTQLTFTGPGGMTLTAMSNNVAAVPQTYAWSVSAGVMAKPSITSPAAGMTGVVLQPVITASAYTVTPAGYDVHLKSQFQALDTSGAVVWDSGEIAATTEVAVTTNWPAETELDIRVRYQGAALGWGEWSDLVRITTQAASGVGVVYPDGGIGGPVMNGYRLIVAPASQRSSLCAFGLTRVDTVLQNITSTSVVDPRSGYDNTNILISNYSNIRDDFNHVGPVAAQFCRDLGPDWYLPNREELAAIVAVAAEIDAADSTHGLSFSGMGTRYIWSSTEWGASYTWDVRADGYIAFQGVENRQSGRIVIPVRREPV